MVAEFVAPGPGAHPRLPRRPGAAGQAARRSAPRRPARSPPLPCAMSTTGSGSCAPVTRRTDMVTERCWSGRSASRSASPSPGVPARRVTAPRPVTPGRAHPGAPDPARPDRGRRTGRYDRQDRAAPGRASAARHRAVPAAPARHGHVPAGDRRWCSWRSPPASATASGSPADIRVRSARARAALPVPPARDRGARRGAGRRWTRCSTGWPRSRRGSRSTASPLYEHGRTAGARAPVRPHRLARPFRGRIRHSR